MNITEADIEKIAQLAHLEITDDERQMFAPQISEIVTYVEQLNAIDTSSVEPALGGLTPEGEKTESSRRDEVQPSLGTFSRAEGSRLIRLHNAIDIKSDR